MILGTRSFWAMASVLFPLLIASNAEGGPGVTLSPSTLNFPSQLATTNSAPQAATLTNVGNQPLTITSIVLDGTFSQTNTCPTSGTLAVGASCVFTVTFMAPNGGPTVQPGFIEIEDNAPPGVQVISLSGTVADFALSASAASQTVSAGSSANYTISVTPSGGFNQAVSFTCGVLPTGAVCSFSPASVTPSGGPVTTTLSLSTTAFVLPRVREGAPRNSSKPRVPGILLLGLTGLLVLRRQVRWGRSLGSYGLAAGLLVLALETGGCGGGGTYNGGGNLITPAGTYTVLVKGSPAAGPSGLSNPLVLTLVVQ